MEHKNDIGKSVREKLGQLDKAPSDGVWAAIEADLPAKKKRRFLPFWIFLTSVVLISSLYFATEFGGKNSINQNNPSEIGQKDRDSQDVRGRIDTDAIQSGGFNSEVITKPNTDSQDSTNSLVDGGNKILEGVTTNPKGATDNSTVHTKPKKSQGDRGNGSNGNRKLGNKKHRGELHRNHTSKNQRNATSVGHHAIVAVGDGKNNSSENVEHRAPLDIDNAGLASKIDRENTLKASESKDSVFASAEKKKDEIKKKPKDTVQTVQIEEENHKTFSLFLYAAPTYYGRFSKISTLDRRLDSIPGSAAVTFNYGGFLCFEYDAKWSFRFGVSKTKLQYTTKGISVSSLNSTNYYNVEYSSGINNQYMAEMFANSQRFDIVQEVSYLEFPIELKYKIFDRKPFSIEAIGGASTLFLKKNSLTGESDNSGSILFGSNKDLSKAYFSLNAGIGLSYRLAENFKINVEPMFKYHIKSHSTAMQGYSIVALAGLEYTFNFNSKKKTVKK